MTSFKIPHYQLNFNDRYENFASNFFSRPAFARLYQILGNSAMLSTLTRPLTHSQGPAGIDPISQIGRAEPIS